MANRYWIGGTGNWNDTSHWSTSSGGSGGASAPDYEDNVFIDENSGFSGGGTILPDGYQACNDLICTSGHTYTIGDTEDSEHIAVLGSIQLEAGITWECNILSLSGNGTIKTNGVKLQEVVIGVVSS